MTQILNCNFQIIVNGRFCTTWKVRCLFVSGQDEFQEAVARRWSQDAGINFPRRVPRKPQDQPQRSAGQLTPLTSNDTAALRLWSRGEEIYISICIRGNKTFGSGGNKFAEFCFFIQIMEHINSRKNREHLVKMISSGMTPQKWGKQQVQILEHPYGNLENFVIFLHFLLLSHCSVKVKRCYRHSQRFPHCIKPISRQEKVDFFRLGWKFMKTWGYNTEASLLKVLIIHLGLG